MDEHDVGGEPAYRKPHGVAGPARAGLEHRDAHAALACPRLVHGGDAAREVLFAGPVGAVRAGLHVDERVARPRRHRLRRRGLEQQHLLCEARHHVARPDLALGGTVAIETREQRARRARAGFDAVHVLGAAQHLEAIAPLPEAVGRGHREPARLRIGPF